MDFWIWIIIMVVVALAKGWGKLSEQVDQDNADAPQPPAQKRRPPRPRPTQPAPVGRATVKPPPRQPPPVRTLTQTRFQREEPVAQVAHAYSPPLPERISAPAAVAVAAVVQKRSSRGGLWAEALRDKHNLRNVIVGNEIIRPPLALREPAEDNLTVG